MANPIRVTCSQWRVASHYTSLSFYQVNPVQSRRLYETASEYADLKGEETVWDLYCGSGTISLFLEQKAKQVYGVEIVPQAIEDVRENAVLNHIENAKFYVGKADEVLPNLYDEEGTYADVIVEDPTQKGCGEKCLETIVKMQPNRGVYVSCDSGTLAKDLQYLCDRGDELKWVRSCDMFPITGHVEMCVLLSKLHEAKHSVNVTLDMNELDITSAESKATYEEIREYVLEKHGLQGTNPYIAQVKRKYGIFEREL